MRLTEGTGCWPLALLSTVLGGGGVAVWLKDMREKLPPEIYENDSFKAIYIQIENFLKTNEGHTSEVFSSWPTDCLDENGSQQSIEDGSEVPRTLAKRSEGDKEVIEQFEPGVYATLVQLQNGTKIFKHVRFSKKQFNSQQAAQWWREHSSKVLQKYSNHGTESAANGETASEQ